jgi:hypothetical protein
MQIPFFQKGNLLLKSSIEIFISIKVDAA